MANYKIEDIEGIGEVTGKKFREAGVKDTDALLVAAAKPGDRARLAEATGLSAQRILKFANMADLYRVSGIGSETAELLEVAGVDTVPELARRAPENLAAKMAEVNEVKKLSGRAPSATEVAKWVAQAKELPRVIEY